MLAAPWHFLHGAMQSLSLFIVFDLCNCNMRSRLLASAVPAWRTAALTMTTRRRSPILTIPRGPSGTLEPLPRQLGDSRVVPLQELGMALDRARRPLGTRLLSSRVLLQGPGEGLVPEQVHGVSQPSGISQAPHPHLFGGAVEAAVLGGDPLEPRLADWAKKASFMASSSCDYRYCNLNHVPRYRTGTYYCIHTELKKGAISIQGELSRYLCFSLHRQTSCAGLLLALLWKPPMLP